MRTFSSNVQSILDQDSIKFFILIELRFPIRNYYLTSFNSNITYNGNTYIGNSGIMEYDSPKFSSVVDREAYRIVVTEFLDYMKEEIENNVVGREMVVRAGFLDSNGDPLTNTSDVLTIYKGYVDSPAITNNWESKVATFEGTSPMSDLDIVIPFVSSRDGMDQRDSDDTSFDNIYGDSVIRFNWGKI